MSINISGTNVTVVVADGQDISKIMADGTVVWEKPGGGYVRDNKRFISFAGGYYVAGLMGMFVTEKDEYVTDVRHTGMAQAAYSSGTNRLTLGTAQGANQHNVAVAANKTTFFDCPVPGNRHIIEKRNTADGKSFEMLVNGEVKATVEYNETPAPTPSDFILGDKTYSVSGRIYGFKVKRAGVLVMDLYPVYKDEIVDGIEVPSNGVYDFVSKRFLNVTGPAVGNLVIGEDA